MTVHIIVAKAKNGVIGRGGDLPWRLSEDLQHFKRTTTGHPIVMGRKTFESMGKLPNRTNIVVSRTMEPSTDVEVVSSLEEGIERASTFSEDIYVIGGGQIYGEALEKNLVDSLIISLVDLEPEGDTFFPSYDEQEWKLIGANYRDGFVIQYFKKKSTLLMGSGYFPS